MLDTQKARVWADENIMIKDGFVYQKIFTPYYDQEKKKKIFYRKIYRVGDNGVFQSI